MLRTTWRRMVTIDEFTKKSSFMDDTYSQKVGREPEPVGITFRLR